MLYISVDLEGFLVGERTRLNGEVVLALLGNINKTGIGKQFFFFFFFLKAKYLSILSSLEIEDFFKNKTTQTRTKHKQKPPEIKLQPQHPKKMMPENSCHCLLGLCKAYWAAGAQLLELQLMLMAGSSVGEGSMLIIKLSCQLWHFFFLKLYSCLLWIWCEDDKKLHRWLRLVSAVCFWFKAEEIVVIIQLHIC